MVEEIWRTVIYKGEPWENYQVSNFGRILSLNYGRTGKSKLLSPVEDKDGYFRVCLCKDEKRKNFLVHRLVAEHFLPNPENLPQVNHKDENKQNNSVENLEWCDCKYNVNYGKRNEKISKKVLQFSLTGEFIREWSSTKEAGRNGYTSCLVAACCRGERKSHKGFKWCYA